MLLHLAAPASSYEHITAACHASQFCVLSKSHVELSVGKLIDRGSTCL